MSTDLNKLNRLKSFLLYNLCLNASTATSFSISNVNKSKKLFIVSSVNTSFSSYYKSAFILSLDPSILKYSGALGAKLSAKSEYLVIKEINEKNYFHFPS